MKKLTKLVSAVAFASALALVGCANPSGGGVPTVETVKASDVKVPDSYKPTAGAKNVVTEDQSNEVLALIEKEIIYLKDTISDILDAEVEKDTDNTEAFKKINAFMEENEKQDGSKDYNNSASIKLKPKSYNLGDDIGSVKLIYGEGTQGINYEKATNTETNNMKMNEVASANILDATKIKIAKGEPRPSSYIKSIVASTSESMELKEITVAGNYDKNNSTQSYKTINNLSFVFDTGKYNGIVVMEMKDTRNNDKYTKYKKITFYDITGKKATSKDFEYTEEGTETENY